MTNVVNQQIQEDQLSGLRSLLGDVSDSKKQSENFTYIVICVLSQIGMDREQNNIEDKGALQQEISKGQTQFATMQQFMALLEGNTQWDSSTKQAYWPPSFMSQHNDQLKNFISAFGQFFNNTSGPNSDTSTTTKNLTIDITLTGSLPGYPKGTKLVIDPVGNKVYYEKPGQSSYTELPGGGAFSKILDHVQTYLSAVEGEIYGSGNVPALTPNGTVPQCLAMAMANLQSQIDDKPESFFESCVQSGASIQSFSGAVDTNPLIMQAESLYSEFSETKGANGISFAQEILINFQSSEPGNSAIWNDMGGMMALWMQNKMANQPSSSGEAPPPNATILRPSGVNYFVVTTWQNILTQSQDAYNLMLKYNIGGNHWGSQGNMESAIAAIKQLLNTGNANDYSTQFAEVQKEINAALANLPASGNGVAEIRAQLVQIQAEVNGAPQPMTATGLFNDVQSSLSMGASTYQSQTQQNAAAVQQDTSQLTSYDKIGQSIITAANQAEQTMVGNQRSS